MSAHVRHVSVLMAALVFHPAGPAAAQMQGDNVAVTTPDLSQARDGAWQRVGDGRPERDEPRRSSLLRDVIGDYGRFFTTRENYLVLGLGLTSSLSLKALDEPIRDSRFNSELWFNEGTTLDHVFESGEVIGSSLIQIGGAVATYGIGSWIGTPGVAALGRDLVRVQLLTQGITQLVKYTARRTRPDGSSQASFPSGHASGTFASATVLQRHYGWKVGIPAFGVASYVAASRLAENKHFLSDVVFGAAVGLAAGRTVTFGMGSTRFELSPLAAQGGAGVQVSVFQLP